MASELLGSGAGAGDDPPGPRGLPPPPPLSGSASSRVHRNLRQFDDHQKRVKRSKELYAYHKDVLADLKAKPFVEPPPRPPAPRPPAPPAGPAEPSGKMKKRASRSRPSTADTFKAPELPSGTAKARTKLTKHLVGKRVDHMNNLAWQALKVC